MKNMVVLYKNEEDHIMCHQINEEGMARLQDGRGNDVEWSDGGRIELDELEEILDREI